MEEHDAIGVTQSWINTSSTDFLAGFALPGCTLFSCERQCTGGGGVLVYVKSGLHPIKKFTAKIDNISVSYIQLN